MKDWLRLKRYIHFLPPIQLSETPVVRAYVTNPKKVAKHRFFPFLRFTKVAKRYRRKTNCLGIREKNRTSSKKPREIFYANHLDSLIFSYYSFILSGKLEEVYALEPRLNDAVLAYRAIPFNKHRNKSSIDFANEVFTYIKAYPHTSVGILCMDVKSFFDSLNHRMIKQQWRKLLPAPTLPDDHFAVFKAITRFRHVEISDVLQEFPEHKTKKLSQLRFRNITSFCQNEEEFRERIVKKGLIRPNLFNQELNSPDAKGIPQGSPISSTLSNLYLLDFDRQAINLLAENGGIYRRYSDDILCVCASDMLEKVEGLLYEMMASSEIRLELQKKKTQKIIGKRADLKSPWNLTELTKFGKKSPSKLGYLGFEFDGKSIYLKQASLSKYYRSTKRLIRRKAVYASYAHRKKAKDPSQNIDDWIYRSRIYKSKSHLGSKKKKINGRVFWGNYLSYAYNAAKTMNSEKIRHQVRNHWKIIESEIAAYESKYGLLKSPSKRNRNPRH